MSKPVCRLCEKQTDLCDSHIHPKFVFKWMKKTGSGNFRKPTEVNKRQQDGPKVKLLCRACEEIFNKHETPFASELFHPILEEMLENEGLITKEYNYDEHFFKFAVSHLWRILIVNIESGDYNPKNEARLIEVEEKWRLFLLDDVYPTGCDQVHFLITDVVDFTPEQPDRFNLYMTRATDGTIGEGEGALMVYTKIARFTFYGILDGFNESDFENTKITPISGQVITPQKMKDGRIGDFIFSRVEALNEYAANLSEAQRQKIEETAMKEMHRLIGSDLDRATSRDR